MFTGHRTRILKKSLSALFVMRKLNTMKKILEQIINVFETGVPSGVHHRVSVMRDAPGNRPQITYGRSQTTEHGTLEELLVMYSEAKGMYAPQLDKYIVMLRKDMLHNNDVFKNLLERAGAEDHIMRDCQDQLFDELYYQPAIRWATKYGFHTWLGKLAIYDSFIQSGRITEYLRNQFPERPPSLGGDEKTWIDEYTSVRKNWLSTHSNELLHKTVYRMTEIRGLMKSGNWMLDTLPIYMRGQKIC